MTLSARVPSFVSSSATSTSEDRDLYRADEEAIYAAITLRGVKDRHAITWRWINPSGQVYVESSPTPVGVQGDSYREVKVFHRMNLKGEAAARQVGVWKTEAILYQTNGDPIHVERTFQIDPAPVPPPSISPVIVELPAPPPPIVDEGISAETIPRPKESAPPEVIASLPLPEPPPRLPPPVTAPPEVVLPEPITVFFAFGKAALTADAQQVLAEKIARWKTAKAIHIRGYHDSIGVSVFNQYLSQKRAEVVAAFLMAQGVERERILAKGEAGVYLVPNDTRGNRKQNRRVIVEVME